MTGFVAEPNRSGALGQFAQEAQQRALSGAGAGVQSQRFGAALATGVVDRGAKGQGRQLGVDQAQRTRDGTGRSGRDVRAEHDAVVAARTEEGGPCRAEVARDVDHESLTLERVDQRLHGPCVTDYGEQVDTTIWRQEHGSGSELGRGRIKAGSSPFRRTAGMAFRFLPLFCALASSALAQAPLVLPASHGTREGTTSTNVPFGRSGAVRAQHVYDAMLFSGPRLITALSFRADGMSVALQKQVDCEIRLSTAPLSLTQTSATFAQNRGVDETIVIGRRILTLPASGAAAQPSPFLSAIPLDVPFGYDPALGGLCVEIVVYQQPPGAYPLDATYVCSSPEQFVGPAACQPQNGTPLRVESASSGLLWGRPWLVRTLDAPPGSLVVLALGGSETGTWNGAQLPVDLTPAGAPGCFVSIDITDTFFQQTLGDGTAAFGFQVPNDPRLTGAWIRFQAGALVNGANALGVLTSQAKKVEVCGFEPVARVWATGTAATDGLREIGTAPVLQVHGQ